MEFVVNEQGCRSLSMDMLTHMRQIAQLISEIEANSSTLRGALGEDYESIARTVRIMTTELGNAQQELNIIISDMNEYMSRVQQARVALN